MASDRFDGDSFLVEQLIRPVVNVYRISRLAPGVGDAEPVGYVRQKRLALKEDIRVYADESESEELFRIKARSVVDVAGRYDVVAADGTRLGVLARRFGRSLLRSTWAILDEREQEVGSAEERSVVVALVRRFTDLPLPYHFTVRADGREVGEVRRRFGLRDRYVLDLSRDAERRIDRRVGVALAVALDALQGR